MTVVVDDCEIGHRAGIAELRCLFVPLARFAKVLLHASPVRVQRAKREHGDDAALFGGGAIKRDGTTIVLPRFSDATSLIDEASHGGISLHRVVACGSRRDRIDLSEVDVGDTAWAGAVSGRRRQAVTIRDTVRLRAFSRARGAVARI